MNIKWNEDTIYSKVATIIIFIGLLPAFAFYIGTEYQETKTILNFSLPQISTHSTPEKEPAQFPNISIGAYKIKTIATPDLEFGGYKNFAIEIYDNSRFKTIPIDNINGGVDYYTISPNKKYLAFAAGVNEGGCSGYSNLGIIDLETLTLVSVPQPDIRPSQPDIIRSNPRNIVDILWVANDTVEVTVGYGVPFDTVCGPYSKETETYTISS